MKEDDIKGLVRDKYRQDIREMTQKVYEEVNEKYPEGKAERDSNVRYVRIPLKYDLGDVKNKRDEIINDLVEELAPIAKLEPKKFQPLENELTSENILPSIKEISPSEEVDGMFDEALEDNEQIPDF
ncbi:hypothetical protein KKG31_00640 [Patescibacteria group bacterium]|nr:hypothetical protein [Patescibacteria group bacterium]MBU1757692.1 hypothetical protein [Patescibacteria group bacterium]